MTPNLRHQMALVTGAGRGIGRAISLALARCGARVVLAARKPSEIEKVAEEIRAAGGSATAIPTDVSRERDIEELFARLRDEFEGRLDVLVNNAGMGIFGPLAGMSATAFDQVIGTNLRGTFLCCRSAMELMQPRKSGYIINISSVVGIKGYPNQAAYTASKHGIMGLTKSLAVEAQAQGIRVSAILPGAVDTTMVANARPDLDRTVLLKPTDVAQAVLYLLSLSEQAAVDEIYIRRRGSAPF